MLDEWSDLESTASSFRKTARPQHRRSRALQPFTEFRPPFGSRAPTFSAPPYLDEELALSAAQSKSMLTCNKYFLQKYPIVYQGICKGLVDVRTLMAYEMVVPIKESIQLKRCLLRRAKNVIRAIDSKLRTALRERFPDPRVSSKVTSKVSAHVWEQLKHSIREAEDDRTILQWLLRTDVASDLDMRLSLNETDGENNTIITHVEGTVHVVRRKGELFSLVSNDSLDLDLDCVLKALFINGGQLAAMNRDSQFIDFVRTGDNRFAKRLMY